MIDYRVSVTEDINSLKELWGSAFEDKNTAIDLFFKRIFKPEICYVADCDGKIVSMLYMLKTSVNGHKACYLYAAATEENYRCKGIMRNLIDFALKNVDAELCITLPANDSLYSFYGKEGFVSLTSNKAVLSRNQIFSLSKPYELQETFVNSYCGVRNRVLKSNFLFWNNNHIDFAFEYNALYGAKIIKSNYGYAIACKENNICNISEIICADSNAPYIFTDLLSAFDCDTFVFHLSPKQKFFKSTPYRHAMVKYLTDYKPENIYTGLTLD